MLWTPQKGDRRIEHNTGSVGAVIPGTSVTTGAAAATKGTPVQLIASTSFDAHGIIVVAFGYGGGAVASEGCLDILVGAATEEVLIPNLLMGYCGGQAGTAQSSAKIWTFPLYIPAGTRIAAQAAGARTSTAFGVAVHLLGGNGIPPWRCGSKVTTYGIGTVPNGTAITPGTSGAEGSWTQITAATSEDHFAFVPSYQLSTDTGIVERNITVDIGIGAATEEPISDGEFWFYMQGNETIGGPIPGLSCFRDVPSGTRMVMRASGNVATNETGNQVALHAVS